MVAEEAGVSVAKLAFRKECSFPRESNLLRCVAGSVASIYAD